MKSYTLNPFLSSLAADGICPGIRDYERIRLMLQSSGNWNLKQFRDVLSALLVKDQDQQALFRRRFDEFFKTEPGEENFFADIDVEQALKDLKLLAKTPDIFLKPLPKLTWKKIGYRSGWGIPLALLTGIFIIAAGMLLYFQPPDFLVDLVAKPRDLVAKPQLRNDVPKPGLGNERKPGLGNERNVREAVHCIREISHVSVFRRSDIPYQCRKYAGMALLFLLSALSYSIYLLLGRKPPRDKPAVWNEEGTRHFPLGSIGGEPAPRLSEAVLDQLAESMGYFRSEEISRDLNVTASAEATVRNSGIPSLIFKKQKQIRSLLILEDTWAEASVWNRIAGELKQGMIRRGIPVVHARFTGSPREFGSPDGSVFRPEDWESQRQGFLLLIFTDGRGAFRLENTFVLESLARWPMAAWMELREPRFWDETVYLPVRSRIPVYPATPDGILKAVKAFVTEQGRGTDLSEMLRLSERIPGPAGMKSDAYIEILLGDALLWAQDCAMMPVFTQGLADALRRQFYPHIPQERIGRLYALPGTSENVSGIRFSSEVSRILRRGFIVRREEYEQEEVLRFLTEKIAEAEPKEKDSPAYLIYEAVKERVRLESDRDNDLKRLSQIALTPAGGFVRSLFEGFGFPGDEDRIPLRFRPKNRHAMQRLARIASNLRIPRLETFPSRGLGTRDTVTYGNKIALGVMTLLFLIFFGQAVNSFMNAPNWEIVGDKPRVPLRLEVQNGLGWKQIDAVGNYASLPEGRTYRVMLEGDADRTPKVFSISQGRLTRIVVEMRSEE